MYKTLILLSSLFLLLNVFILGISWCKTNDNIIKLSEEKPAVFDVQQLRFKHYLKDFNKNYYGDEYFRRFENFKASLKEITRLNNLEGSKVFGLTKFSDLSKEEFLEKYTIKNYQKSPCFPRHKFCFRQKYWFQYYFGERNVSYGDVPTNFDWRDQGVVGPVLDQKLCLGCWAFSIVGNMESMAAIRKIDHKRRSIQELIDCSAYNDGCRRGNVASALDYLCSKRYNVKIVTEEEYPLTLADNERCYLPAHPRGRVLKEFYTKCLMNEDSMVEKIATHGPLIAVVDASNWMNYIGGIIQRACSNVESNHVVQIVGYYDYKEDDKIPYFLIKNSFGEDFGDNGYVKIAMNENVCGIANQISYIEVA